DFLDEQPLAADLRQARLCQPIAGRLDDDVLALRARALADQRTDRARLHERQLTPARADFHACDGVGGHGLRMVTGSRTTTTIVWSDPVRRILALGCRLVRAQTEEAIDRFCVRDLRFLVRQRLE